MPRSITSANDGCFRHDERRKEPPLLHPARCTREEHFPFEEAAIQVPAIFTPRRSDTPLSVALPLLFQSDELSCRRRAVDRRLLAGDFRGGKARNSACGIFRR